MVHLLLSSGDNIIVGKSLKDSTLLRATMSIFHLLSVHIDHVVEYTVMVVVQEDIIAFVCFV